MISNNPWADIPKPPAGKFSRLRVNSSTKFALFWIRDEMNNLGLVIEISKDISVVKLKDVKINIRDISIDVLDITDASIRAITIKLHDEQNRDVFLKLCMDLIERITIDDNVEKNFQLVCHRLKKWQSLLSQRSKNLLSANEIQGLFAELSFIAYLLANRSYAETIVIGGWLGPERTQHDFVLDDTAIEVKSVGGNQRGKVRISSEDQLQTHLSKLYLQVYFLSEVESMNVGESLNAIARRIYAQIVDGEAKELFELKLNTARYIDIADYDLPLFRVNDTRTYLVADGFPRITRDSLPEGVETVSYDLVLASIDRFRTLLQIKGE